MLWAAPCSPRLAQGVARRFGLGWHACGKVSARCVTVGLHPVPTDMAHTWYVEGAHVFVFTRGPLDEWLHAGRSKAMGINTKMRWGDLQTNGRAMQSAKPLGWPEASFPPVEVAAAG